MCADKALSGRDRSPRGEARVRVVAWPSGDRRLLGRATRHSFRQRGIALIVVLWLTVLITVIASGFAYSMRGEALAARNMMSLSQARAAADGAVERMAFELMRPRNLADVWKTDGLPHSWKEGDIEITATAVDEGARIDINTGSDALLKGLLQNVGGLDQDAAQRVLEAILDWRDPDDLRRPNGAEALDYRAAGLKYVPNNRRFETTAEVGRVLGVTPALMVKIAESVTVYSQHSGINPATASRDVLLSLPGITADQVDAFIAGRAEALAQRLPIPPLPQVRDFTAGAVIAWRINAQARMPDGVTFVRDAVLSTRFSPQRPLVVLLWQEGTPRSRPDAAPADQTATQK